MGKDYVLHVSLVHLTGIINHGKIGHDLQKNSGAVDMRSRYAPTTFAHKRCPPG